MATPEERLDVLEEANTQRRVIESQILDIAERTELRVGEVAGSVRALQISSTIVDARLNAIDARLTGVESKMSTLDAKMDQVLALLKKPGE